MIPLDILATYGVAVSASDALSGRAVIKATFRDKRVADVDLDFSNRLCTVALNAFDFDEEVVGNLEKTPALSFDREHYPSALDALDKDIRSTAESVLNVWKYIIARDEVIPDGALAAKSLTWRRSGSSEPWEKFPGLMLSAFAVGQIPSLVGKSAELLQEAVDDGMVPLVGMAYLHRAKMERDPRYRWVDATVAAELCIKEILIAARSEAEVLLNNLPSPPLSKLYGEVLEAYLGERSPYLKTLTKGVETRNKLVHRPQSVEVSMSIAHDYVIAVERAIFHAWELLHRGKAYLAPQDYGRPAPVDFQL